MVDRVLSFLRSGVFPVICMIGGLFLIAYWFGEGHGAALSRLSKFVQECLGKKFSNYSGIQARLTEPRMARSLGSRRGGLFAR